MKYIYFTQQVGWSRLDGLYLHSKLHQSDKNKKNVVRSKSKVSFIAGNHHNYMYLKHSEIYQIDKSDRASRYTCTLNTVNFGLEQIQTACH